MVVDRLSSIVMSVSDVEDQRKGLKSGNAKKKKKETE
jgi:hypothetical protein